MLIISVILTVIVICIIYILCKTYSSNEGYKENFINPIKSSERDVEREKWEREGGNRSTLYLNSLDLSFYKRKNTTDNKEK